MKKFTYTARMPFLTTEEDIEALRGLGAVHIVFEIEAESRKEAITELGDEFEWRGWGRDWWDRSLQWSV